MSKIKLIILTTIVTVMVHGCKPLQSFQQSSIKPMPASFDNNRDTANTATINWRQFFSDKNLVNLIDTALVNNWDVQTAWQRIKMAESGILFAKSFLKLTVDAGAAVGLTRFGLYTMDGAGNKGTEIHNGKDIPVNLPDYFTGLQTSWEIDLWGKLKNSKKAAVARYLSSIEGRNLVLTELITEIASAYHELLSLDQNLKIINETITLQENALEIVKVQKEAAVVNELAVKQFEAQLLNIKGMRYETLQQIAETENRINFLTGRYPETVERDTSVLVNTLPPEVKTGIPATLLQNRPDIRQAEFELAATKADVLTARAAFYPSLNIDGSIGFQAFKAGLLFKTPESVAFGLLGSLSAPLINKAAIKAEFNRANAAQLEALYNYQKTIVNGYVEVYNEMQRLKNLQQVFELKTNEVNVLTQSIDISSELFRTARANYLEVLLTQQTALQARLELIETKKNQFLSTINIYKALGGGWR